MTDYSAPITKIPLLVRILPFAVRTIRDVELVSKMVTSTWCEAAFDFGLRDRLLDQFADATKQPAVGPLDWYAKFWCDASFILRDDKEAVFPPDLRAALYTAIVLENDRAVDITRAELLARAQQKQIRSCRPLARMTQQLGTVDVAFRNTTRYPVWRSVVHWHLGMKQQKTRYIDVRATQKARDRLRFCAEATPATNLRSVRFSRSELAEKRKARWQAMQQRKGQHAAVEETVLETESQQQRRNNNSDDDSDRDAVDEYGPGNSDTDTDSYEPAPYHDVALDNHNREDDAGDDDTASSPGDLRSSDYFLAVFFRDCNLLSRVQFHNLKLGGGNAFDAKLLPRALVSLQAEHCALGEDMTIVQKASNNNNDKVDRDEDEAEKKSSYNISNKSKNNGNKTVLRFPELPQSLQVLNLYDNSALRAVVSARELPRSLHSLYIGSTRIRFLEPTKQHDAGASVAKSSNDEREIHNEVIALKCCDLPRGLRRCYFFGPATTGVIDMQGLPPTLDAGRLKSSNGGNGRVFR